MAVDRQRIYHKRDRLRQLRVFCHAARMESISRAAESLGLSQPAVSLHVRELEHEMEAMLFDRSGPRIALTSAGERLFRLANPMVEAMDRLPDAFTEGLDDLISGEVRMTAGPSGVAFVLPPFLKRFRDEYPGIRLQVRNALVVQGLELLSANEVDFVVGGREPETKDFLYHPVFSYELVLITSLDHPLAGRESVDIREAAEYPAIVPPAGTYNRQFGESIAHRFGVEAKVAIEASGWGVIKGYVEAGLGISIVPSLCLGEKERLWVIPFGQHARPRSYGVFTRRGRNLSPPAERFIRMMAPDFPPVEKLAPEFES